MRRHLKILVFLILSFPKTLYFNFKSLSLCDAIKLPLIIGYNVKILELHRGIVHVEGRITPGMILVGYGGSRGISIGKSYLCFERGKVVFTGKARFAQGISIRVNGKLKFGKNFAANRNLFVSCSDSITIGNDVLVGWNCTIRDSDGHTVIQNGLEKRPNAPVTISNHVWICSESNILKGVSVGDDSVIAYGTVVTKSIDKNTLVGGNPAKQISDNISWKY